MIVIGVDVHKQTVTAVAVDEAGRLLDELPVQVGSDELAPWALALGDERLWALEDCRQLTRWLERQLLERGEEVVRVSPKLTVPERRAGRARGKSDPIDASGFPDRRLDGSLLSLTSSNRGSETVADVGSCVEAGYSWFSAARSVLAARAPSADQDRRLRSRAAMG
jgi:Transposase